MLRSLLLAVLAVTLFHQAAWGRKWTDVTGSFSVEAELVAVKAGYALLKRADGSEVSVPILKLSAADRAFIRKKMVELMSKYLTNM